MKRMQVSAVAAICFAVSMGMAVSTSVAVGQTAPAAGHDHGLPLIVQPGATTVQLPTFNMFTISTTVLVPDRGSMSLGGSGGSRSASHSNGGPGFANRAGGSSSGASSLSVGVQVHDLAAMDQALLDEAKKAKQSEANTAWATRFEQARQSSAGRPTISVAEARRLRDTAPAEKR